MQTEKYRTEDGVGTCKSATFLSTYSWRHWCSSTRTGKHFPPKHNQAMINTAGPLKFLYQNHSSEAPGITRSFRTITMLNMNLRQWNLKYITNLTFGYGAEKNH